MRVITVNVCGIRAAAAKGLFRWLRRQDADFICLQETRSHEHQLGEHPVRLPGYHSLFCDAERKGYAGVALYTRHTPERVRRGFGRHGATIARRCVTSTVVPGRSRMLVASLPREPSPRKTSVDRIPAV